MEKEQTERAQQLFDCYDGRLTEAEQRETVSWIEASDSNRRTARRIFSLLLALDLHRTKKAVDTERALKQVRAEMKERNKRKLHWWQWAQRIAAILFIPLLTLLLWQHHQQQTENTPVSTLEVSTQPGMTAQLTLPDGSRVHLNSSSTLSYPQQFGEDTRSVRLSGEAYFEVTKDEQRRFVVHTPGQSAIEVYGTRFNVEAYPDYPFITTTLTEGSVGFVHGEGKEQQRTLLQPGEKLTYNLMTQETTRKRTTGVTELAWKDGEIIFNDTPLSEALRILGKRFNVVFTVKNPQLNDDRFTGSFSTQPLDKILKHFEISSHIRWRYTEKANSPTGKTKIDIY